MLVDSLLHFFPIGAEDSFHLFILEIPCDRLDWKHSRKGAHGEVDITILILVVNFGLLREWFRLIMENKRIFKALMVVE